MDLAIPLLNGQKTQGIIILHEGGKKIEASFCGFVFFKKSFFPPHFYLKERGLQTFEEGERLKKYTQFLAKCQEKCSLQNAVEFV